MHVSDEFDRALSSEAQELLRRAGEYGRTEIAPAAKEWEYARRFPLEAFRRACAAGFASVELPASFGGQGLPFSAKMRLAEEFSRHDLAFTFALVQQQNVMLRLAEVAAASTAQALVPRMATGELVGCTAMSEPGTGSDFGAIRTRATKVRGGWELSGEKGWIANAAVADVILTFAQTDPGAGNDGIACFIVRADAPGFRRHPPYELHGGHAIGVGGFTLERHFVPDDALLYPPGKGFKSAMQGVNRARAYVAAMNAGLLDASLAIALRYGEEREAFGMQLLDFQGLRWKLVDVATDLEALRLLTYRAARLIDGGEDAQQAAAMAKKFANEHALGGVAACMQAMGANGLRSDYPLARHLAAARLLAYTDGSIEMMNERIGALLRRQAGPFRRSDE